MSMCWDCRMWLGLNNFHYFFFSTWCARFALLINFFILHSCRSSHLPHSQHEDAPGAGGPQQICPPRAAPSHETPPHLQRGGQEKTDWCWRQLDIVPWTSTPVPHYVIRFTLITWRCRSIATSSLQVYIFLMTGNCYSHFVFTELHEKS